MTLKVETENQLAAASAASSNQSGSNDFVKKLFLMLQDESYKDVVRWTLSGDSFVVLNTNEFTKDILPRHFKHSNFASFVRQLNKYDFHKVKVSNEEKLSYPYGEDAWEFKHPDFKFNDRESLENIKRKGPSVKKVLPTGTNGTEIKVQSTTCNHNFSQITNSQNHIKEQMETLRADNKALHQELNVLQTKYKTLVENIVAINTTDERYHRSMGILVNCLLQAGIKLPPLDFPNSPLMSLPVPQTIPGATIPIVGATVPLPAPPHLTTLPIIKSPKLTTTRLQNPPPPKPVIAQHIASVLPPTKRSPNGDSITPVQQSPFAKSVSGSPPASTAAIVPQITTTNLPNPKFHVLLVEDDNVCIQLCRKFLVKYGCQVTVVTDGLNAISTVEHTNYDLVLMDIVMPNLDGATATSVIRSFDTKTPIIAMTGNIEDNDLVTYLQNGMSDILAKPFTKDDLYSILSKHLLTDKSKAATDSATPTVVGTTPNEPNVSEPASSSLDPLSSTDSNGVAEPLPKKKRLQ
ncbi:HSF-type DNA-binding-domain-containing protein [Scheffersomyces coipomensis]|uniref:HSF-type DNA-binding-domain-containing protein n=1 Tax=Scheffersomyces coipomensis TaxID=1788519 RepID=UPI00315D334D